MPRFTPALLLSAAAIVASLIVPATALAAPVADTRVSGAQALAAVREVSIGAGEVTLTVADATGTHPVRVRYAEALDRTERQTGLDGGSLARLAAIPFLLGAFARAARFFNELARL